MDDYIPEEIIERVDLMSIAKDYSYEELLDVCRLVPSIKNICNNIELWERNMEYYKIEKGFDYQELFDDSIYEKRPIYISILLKKKYNINVMSLIVAMESASEDGHLMIVDKLLQNEKINLASDNNNSLGVAAQNGHISVVKRLLKDSRVDPTNEALIVAIENDHLEIVDVFLQDQRINPSSNHNDALMTAIHDIHTTIAKRLLEDSRVDPSDNGNRAIWMAAKNNMLDIVEILLNDSSVDPTDQNNMAIENAYEYYNKDIVKKLLEDQRVRNSLSKKEIEQYENFIKE